ncbi:DUF86 domain-containing protein [Neobacillus mesonae]|uniref:DUF86 domain-containing protein n=1 Tax=Neobacillus mesonae TaxID=1193713 RepID=UPI00203CF154|nr:DUF86 domain-containing protein [Neobacillus mesonae]MCM3567584.1 DUF86 domain-containing protein [Neobacillus mesonae]
MYFVDREKIGTILVYLEAQVQLFSSREEWQSPLEKAALERIAQMSLESVLDVGNAMIDGFIMRDPGSYEDIIDILMDEKVVSAEIGESLKGLISFRKPLVRAYTEVDHEKLFEQYAASVPALTTFAANVRDYLENELGPVSAFKN